MKNENNQGIHVTVCSRQAVLELLLTDHFPTNTAVVSFYTPKSSRTRSEERVCYEGVCDRVFAVGIPDIDPPLLPRYGYTYESFLSEADALADFICEAIAEGRDLLCQCDYGQSRSAACAAAILEHFEGRGIDVFSDYRYYPSQLVYHKIFDALEQRKKKTHHERSAT